MKAKKMTTTPELDMQARLIGTASQGSDEQNLPAEIQQIYEKWHEIAQHPAETLVDWSGTAAFTAGGPLPAIFGSEQSHVWQLMSKALAQNGEVMTIAGVEFSRRELELIGQFYRFLREDHKLLCIDERLEISDEEQPLEVHESCGACAATGAALKSLLGAEVDVEAQLAGEISQEDLQAIYPDMPLHTSLVVLVDLHADDVVASAEKRAELKRIGALPFTVSLPVGQIEAFLTDHAHQQDRQALIATLIKWNVNIARNIIGGHHNTLHNEAEHALFVVDLRNLATDSLLAQELLQQIEQVSHGEMISIVDEQSIA